MTAEVEQTLQKRLDESNIKKEAQLAKIRELQVDLEKKLKKIPRRPRETIKELDDRAKALEHKRTITSIALAEERQILKEIKGIKRTKVQVEEYNKMEDQVQSMKKQLNIVRDNLHETFTGMDEIQTALGKVKLANKLDCGTHEISTKEMHCPKARLGMVIGKNGSMVKQIQDTCKVSIEVNKGTEKITITGTDVSIERAMKEIERIIRIEEEAITLETTLLNYLTAKYVHVIQQLRDEYPDASLSLSRIGGKLLIRGNPEELADIKAKVFGEEIMSKERNLAGREFNVLLGKKGATIDRLCSEHSISIEIVKINDSNTTAVFTGPSNMVEAALSKVEELINNNREVVEVISISPLIKNILLAESGRHIKDIQAKVVEAVPEGNCYISINNDRIAKDHPELLVKAKKSMVSEALQFTRDVMKDFDELVVKCSVDPYAIPRIIGKGGETIKKLTGGKPAFVEVDRVSGELSYGATSVEVLDDLRKQVEEVIDNNSVLRIKSYAAILVRQFRELNRSGLKNQLNGICWLDIDEDESCYIIRGKKQDLEKGKAVIEKFIVNNQFGEVQITDEDREALLSGGRKSKIVQFTEEMGVKLQIDRIKFCVIVCGPLEKVDETIQKLNQYLNGGNGHSVAKLCVTEQVVGIVIGKGGKTRQQLEQKHDGVAINISKSHVVTIRGPSQAVADCRVEIGKMVASARVTQSISITDEQKASLEKKEYAKKLYQQMPVHVTTTDDKVVVRGTFHDVRDAMSLLNEMLTGEYKISIELDASQFSKVRNTVRDPTHFERIESACEAKVELDLTDGSVSISGKRSNVKRAKDQVYGLLDFILPNELNRLKITKPLCMSVGQASALAQISAEAGGVSVYLDRDLSLIVIRSINEEKVKKATELINEKIKEAERLAYVFEVSASDSWILPIIIGKKGSNVIGLRSKHPGCKIDISKEFRTITVIGETEEIVQEVREAVLTAIETARSENMFVLIPNTYVSPFLGRAGSHVKELTAKYEVEIQRVKKGEFNFKISGEVSKVKAAKEAIDTWLVMRENSNARLTFSLEREQDIAAIIGQKGIVARSIEEDFKCKIDVDKKTLVVTVKGQSEEQREAAMNKMKELVEKYRDEATARQALAKEQRENIELVATKDNATAMEPVPAGSQNLPKTKNIDLDALKVEEEDKKSQIPPKEEDKKSQFPSKPVGVAADPSKNGNGKKKKKKKKVDASLTEGTEAGKSLFAMLMSQD